MRVFLLLLFLTGCSTTNQVDSYITIPVVQYLNFDFEADCVESEKCMEMKFPGK